MKRALILLMAIMVLLIVLRSGIAYVSSSSDASTTEGAPSISRQQAEPVLEASRKNTTTMAVATESVRLLDDSSNAREDIAIIQELLQEYRRNLGGNPVGENDEVTAALLGTNEKQLVYLADVVKRLIDDNGRLTDRWGNPYVFHALSGNSMEIRSAGSDGIPYNADDLISE